MRNMSSKEGSALLGKDATPTLLPSKAWLLFAVFFSLNHASVTTCVSLASSLISPSYAGMSNSLLYGFFGAVALTFAPEAVRVFGPRQACVTAMMLTCLYLLSFFAATRYAGVSADTEPPLVFVVVGGILGGIGVGLMWVAQGAYMTRIAITYAEEQRIDVVTATTRLAGTFALVLLAMELSMKLLISLLTSADDGSKSQQYDTPLLLTLLVLAFIAVLPMVYFRTALELSVAAGPVTREREGVAVTATSGGGSSGLNPWGRLSAVTMLIWRDPAILLLVAPNASFGLSNALIIQKVNRLLVSSTLGLAAVGGLGSLTVGVAVLVTLPQLLPCPLPLPPGLCAGKPSLMIIDACVRLLTLVMALILHHYEPSPSAAHVAWWWLALSLLYAAHGVNRGLFESTSKGMTADYFAAEPEAAFAATILFQAVASVFMFCFTDHAPLGSSIGICAVFCIATPPSMLAIWRIHDSRITLRT